MSDILELYYGMSGVRHQEGYFYYEDELYYLFYVEDIQRFLDIYYCYRYMMEMCQCKGYMIVKNRHQDIVSQNHILFKYIKENFDFSLYLNIFLQPQSLPQIKVVENKERWIHKIDCVKEKTRDYAYSFQHDQDVLSLIYYYCGLGENSICILNEILKIDEKASIPLSLSLHHPVQNRIFELLNPCYYTLSSKAKHITCLLESHILTGNHLIDIVQPQYFNVYEMIYLYARFLYPGTFYNHILTSRLQAQDVQFYYKQIKLQKENYEILERILSNYIRIPKISWLYT